LRLNNLLNKRVPSKIKIPYICHCLTATPSKTENMGSIGTTFARLKGRVAIVVGASSGIGRAIAVAYAREGAKVVCASRAEMSGGHGMSTSDLIKTGGGTSIFHSTDISSVSSIDDLVQKAVKTYGRLDMYGALQAMELFSYH
jgi:5,10-methylene-tetrahydrofolate dehydrogenase/methenyl tetrahydrofolate cyclohydrolase